MPTEKEGEMMETKCVFRLIAQALGANINIECAGSKCAQWSKSMENCGLKTTK